MNRVLIGAGQDPKEVAEGNFKPQRVTAEPVQTAIYVCDGAHRTEGQNGFQFSVECGCDLARCRTVKLTEVIVPKLPTINKNNNVITMRHQNDGGQGSPVVAFLSCGFYNQVSLATELKNAIDIAWSTLPGGADTCSVSFDAKTKTFTISSNGGLRWYIINTCSFALRGINVAKFTYHIQANNVSIIGSVSHTTSPVGLIYSRYINVFSSRLVENAFTSSRTSKNGDASIIGSISLVNDYSASDFDSSGLFTGNFISDAVTNESPRINIAHFQKNINRVDFRFEDEFGLTLDRSLNFGTDSNGITYPDSSFNCCAWLLLGT